MPNPNLSKFGFENVGDVLCVLVELGTLVGAEIVGAIDTGVLTTGAVIPGPEIIGLITRFPPELLTLIGGTPLGVVTECPVRLPVMVKLPKPLGRV